MIQRSMQRLIGQQEIMGCLYTTTTGVTELPRRLQKSERKELVTGINELKRRARLERVTRQEVHEIILKPPENGMLVKGLVPVAHEVNIAREELYHCVSNLSKTIPIHVCKVCGEVHIGESPHRIRTCDIAGSLPTKEHSWGLGRVEHVLPPVESFHLYDRSGRAVSHGEQLQVDRIAAIVELCIQAGVDIPEYPTKRRAFPVYNVAGKTIDFERKFPRDWSSGLDIQPYGFWTKKKTRKGRTISSGEDTREIANRGMKAWKEVSSGATKLMQKYAVWTCGYCTEVQVGPKGHRARNCQSYKHQMRAGQHAWQQGVVDDIVPPVYVWHVAAHARGPLVDGLRRYYGKLPAAVELFAQAGADVGEEYGPVMRKDVAVPSLDEEKWVV